jgi:hypothetical protein
MDSQHNISGSTEQHIAITIAEILIEVHSPLSVAELGIAEKFGTFLFTPDNPLDRVSLQWHKSDSPPAPCGELIYDPGSIWKMYRDGEQFYAAMNYADDDSGKVAYELQNSNTVNLADCQYFTTNALQVKGELSKDYSGLDSFVILMNVGGACELYHNGEAFQLNEMEAILLPASLNNITIKSEEEVKLLEVYVK